MKFLNVPLCIPYRIGKYSATKAALEVRKRWKENLMQINGISSSAYKPEPSGEHKKIWEADVFADTPVTEGKSEAGFLYQSGKK